MSSSSLMSLPDLELGLQPGRPAVLRAEPDGDAPGWAAAHHDAVRDAATEHGAVLLRGLKLRDPAATAAVVRELTTGLMTEREAYAPRQDAGERLSWSTPWPANQPMRLHHELSYARQVPGLMAFACLCAPAVGGATTLADAATVLAALPADVVARFEREGWLLLRSYDDEIGASVAEAFGTDDRAAIEAYCRANGIETAWQPGGGLRTRQRRPAVITHPRTGRRCWFNQVAFLNEWTLPSEVHEYLVDVYGADGLPFTTRFGDGEPIDEDVIAMINEVYEMHTTRVSWQDGDLMLVDNLATAHGRDPYEGPREMLVAMADPVRLTATADPGWLR